MAVERKNISQPSEWWRAFEAEADRHGQTLSGWVADCCLANLPADVLKTLPTERPPAHRPRIQPEQGTEA